MTGTANGRRKTTQNIAVGSRGRTWFAGGTGRWGWRLGAGSGLTRVDRCAKHCCTTVDPTGRWIVVVELLSWDVRGGW